MLEAHYHKSKDGCYGGRPSSNALKLMEGGLLQDYLNEAGPQVCCTSLWSNSLYCLLHKYFLWLLIMCISFKAIYVNLSGIVYNYDPI